MRIFLIICFLFVSVAPAYAIQETSPLAIDRRIRTLTYNPNEVYVFIAHYGYQSSIEFSVDEQIGAISLGDSISWQIEPVGNRIFIKPIEPDATTNMTVVTDKHTYHFELYAEEADDIRDEDLVFSAVFHYPEHESAAVRQFQPSSVQLPDLENEAEKYHFNYTLTGSEYIAPVRIFDDGEFTYFEFREQNAEIPAFFVVDSTGSESLVNYRIMDKYVVVERVASQFTLRNGPDIVCVYNESRPLVIQKPKEEEKKRFWIF